MKAITLLLTLIATSSGAQVLPDSAALDSMSKQTLAQVDAMKNMRRLTDGNVLLTDADLAKARLADCQPSKGDLVTVKNITKAPGGAMAFVEIETGFCEKHTGWVGTGRLETLTASEKQ